MGGAFGGLQVPGWGMQCTKGAAALLAQGRDQRDKKMGICVYFKAVPPDKSESGASNANVVGASGGPPDEDV